jgi:hypothetical protein
MHKLTEWGEGKILDVGRGNMVECEITTGPLRIKITIF